MFKESTYENMDFSDQFIDVPEIARKKFLRCDFSAADFSEVSILYNSTFQDCSFSSAKLNGVEIRHCAFLNCSFKFASFFAAAFDDCKMTGSSFVDADCSLLTITGGDWSFTVLRGLEMSKKTMNGVNFMGADFTGARLTKCIFTNCNFQEIIANQMSLRGSDIRTCQLDNVDILAIDLQDTKVDLPQCVLIAEAIGAKYKAGES